MEIGVHFRQGAWPHDPLQSRPSESTHSIGRKLIGSQREFGVRIIPIPDVSEDVGAMSLAVAAALLLLLPASSRRPSSASRSTRACIRLHERVLKLGREGPAKVIINLRSTKGECMQTCNEPTAASLVTRVTFSSSNRYLRYSQC